MDDSFDLVIIGYYQVKEDGLLYYTNFQHRKNIADKPRSIMPDNCVALEVFGKVLMKYRTIKLDEEEIKNFSEKN